MKIRSHVIASIIFSILVFVVFKSWKISVASFLSGVLIDCDHILDYFREFRKHFRLKEFFDVHHNNKVLFSMIVFHSWELLLPLNLYAFFVSGNSWIIGITIGLTQHVVLDQIFNNSNWLTYFFFWRLKNGFNLKKIFQTD